MNKRIDKTDPYFWLDLVTPDVISAIKDEAERAKVQQICDRLAKSKANNETFKLSEHVNHLMYDEPFICALSRSIKKVPNRKIPTARVIFYPSIVEYVMEYNPGFMLQLTPRARRGVLLHEFFHIALGHLEGRMPAGFDRGWINQVQDAAINSLDNVRSYIDDAAWLSLHKNGIVLAKVVMPGRGAFKDAPPGKSMDWYLENVKPPEPDDGQDPGEDGEGSDGYSGSQDQVLDDHDWDQSEDNEGQPDHMSGDGSDRDSQERYEGLSDEDLKEIARQKMKNNIEKAADAADRTSSGWGTVSLQTRYEIRKALSKIVDPAKILESFIKKSQKASRRRSMMKINRRLPYIRLGRKTDHRAHIAIARDESGSVSDAMFAKFSLLMEKFAKYATFTLVPFDDRVFEKEVLEWRKGQRLNPPRVLCGGTNFDAPTDWVNDRAGEYDGLIILTDMCAPAPGRCKVQRMWITDAQHINSPYYKPKHERLICLDKKE